MKTRTIVVCCREVDPSGDQGPCISTPTPVRPDVAPTPMRFFSKHVFVWCDRHNRQIVSVRGTDLHVDHPR